jgi:predicted transposase/invertase (TIGR01784 family)
VFYDKLTYIYLEMPKFNKTEAELETHFEKWLYVLKNLEDLTDRPAKLQERIFAKLFEQAEIANYSEEEYSEYQESLKVYRDLKNSIDTAYDEGKAEGLAEGIKKGLAEGVEKGLAEGKAEGIRLTAQKLKQEGLSVEMIAKVTGLTVEEIAGLV